jgi:murein DD-endopeptidase MepM/ murein hydrolase activator NlpD
MAIKRRFREERVEITDDFLAARLPAFAALFPQERDPVERFKKLNTELRRQNAAFIGSLSAKSGPVPLWDGGFIYLPRSVVRGSFGADRIYMYKGQEIGRELSDGIGLASVPGAQVPAANAGDVVFAGPLGVYGNTVVMDHGMGLLTVYANLGSIAVKVGDVLKKGEPLGTTGTTGLTPGDQVHFAVYLSGQPVIPIEWWDGHWIEDNVTTKLRRYAAETPQQ